MFHPFHPSEIGCHRTLSLPIGSPFSRSPEVCGLLHHELHVGLHGPPGRKEHFREFGSAQFVTQHFVRGFLKVMKSWWVSGCFRCIPNWLKNHLARHLQRHSGSDSGGNPPQKKTWVYHKMFGIEMTIWGYPPCSCTQLPLAIEIWKWSVTVEEIGKIGKRGYLEITYRDRYPLLLWDMKIIDTQLYLSDIWKSIDSFITMVKIVR